MPLRWTGPRRLRYCWAVLTAFSTRAYPMWSVVLKDDLARVRHV